MTLQLVDEENVKQSFILTLDNWAQVETVARLKPYGHMRGRSGGREIENVMMKYTENGKLLGISALGWTLSTVLGGRWADGNT